MADSTQSLTSIGAYAAGLYTFDRITRANNRIDQAYIGWADCGGSVDGTCFTEWDVGAFLSGDYKGQPTNPTLRFTVDPEKAVQNKYRLNWLTPERSFPTPDPSNPLRTALPFATYQDFLNESRNLFHWVNRTSLPSLLNDEKVTSYGAKNKYVWGRDGVAWLSADKAGKVYEWKGNNSVANGRLDTDQAFKGSRDGNQLNFWNDSSRLNPAGGVGISAINLRMESDATARLIDVRQLGDPRTIVPSSATKATDIRFQYLPSDKDVATFQFEYTESSSSETKLVSSVTSEKETENKFSIELGGGWQQGKDEGFNANVKTAYENISKEKTASTSSTDKVTTKAVGNKFSFTFSPSAIKPGQRIAVTQADGSKSSFEMTPGIEYRAYLTVTRSSLSSSLGGLARYSGSFGRLPLQSVFFGTSNDNLRSHDDQSPALQNATVGDYIDVALRKGLANEVFDLPKVKKIDNGNVSEIPQIDIDERGRLVTNLLWNSEDNIETNVWFRLDRITSPSTALARLDEIPSVEAIDGRDFLVNASSLNRDFLAEAHDYFIDSSAKYSATVGAKNEGIVTSPDLVKASLKSPLKTSLSDTNRYFVLPLQDSASSTSLDAETSSVQNDVGQSLFLDSANNAGIGLLQDNLSIFGSDEADRVMISGGNLAEGGLGNDLLIHYADIANAKVAYLNGGEGDDIFESTGGSTVMSGGNGDDTAYAKGKATFYGDGGRDRLIIEDTIGTKFFSDYDLFEDDLILTKEVLYRMPKLSSTFDYQHMSFEIKSGNDTVISVALGHELLEAIDITLDGDLSKDDVLAYMISEAGDKPLSRSTAKNILSQYFSNKSSGSDLFSGSFMAEFSSPHDTSVWSGAGRPGVNAVSVSRSTRKQQILDIVMGDPLIEKAVNPWIKLIDPKANALNELSKADLIAIYKTYREVLSLYEMNMVYSSSGSDGGLLTLPMAAGSSRMASTEAEDLTAMWDTFSDLSVSLVTALFQERFINSQRSEAIDVITGRPIDLNSRVKKQKGFNPGNVLASAQREKNHFGYPSQATRLDAEPRHWLSSSGEQIPGTTYDNSMTVGRFMPGESFNNLPQSVF